MYLTTGNDITLLEVPTDSNTSYSVDYMLNTSFSEFYLSNGSSVHFNIDVTVTNPDYLATTGNNIFDTCSSVIFSYYNGSTFVQESAYTPD